MKYINSARKIQLIGSLGEVTKPYVKNVSFILSVCNLVVATKPFVGFA